MGSENRSTEPLYLNPGVYAEPTDIEETAEDGRRRFATYLERIREYHSPRRLDGDGFTMIWCRECRQNWPCPTAEAVDGRW